jgi:hypothetical protein
VIDATLDRHYKASHAMSSSHRGARSLLALSLNPLSHYCRCYTLPPYRGLSWDMKRCCRSPFHALGHDKMPLTPCLGTPPGRNTMLPHPHPLPLLAHDTTSPPPLLLAFPWCRGHNMTTPSPLRVAMGCDTCRLTRLPLCASPGTWHSAAALASPWCDIAAPFSGRISSSPSLPLFTSPALAITTRARHGSDTDGLVTHRQRHST